MLWLDLIGEGFNFRVKGLNGLHSMSKESHHLIKMLMILRQVINTGVQRLNAGCDGVKSRINRFEVFVCGLIRLEKQFLNRNKGVELFFDVGNTRKG